MSNALWVAFIGGAIIWVSCCVEGWITRAIEAYERRTAAWKDRP